MLGGVCQIRWYSSGDITVIILGCGDEGRQAAKDRPPNRKQRPRAREGDDPVPRELGPRGLGRVLAPRRRLAEKEGERFGGLTHLKELCLKLIGLRAFEIKQFCEGLASNRSITRLEVYEWGAWGGDVWNYISPFLEQNGNLSCLMVDFTASTGSVRNGMKSLANVLSRFNTLMKFECKRVNNECRSGDLCDTIAKYDFVDLIRALGRHPHLIEIDLHHSLLRREGAVALAGMLQCRQRSVRGLRLGEGSLDDEGVEILAPALGANSTLQDLALDRNSDVTARGWHDILSAVDLCSSSLKNLSLGGIPSMMAYYRCWRMRSRGVRC